MSEYEQVPTSVDHEFGGSPIPKSLSYQEIQSLTEDEYEQLWQQWHKKRENKLSSEYGWLSLRSIDWLKDGKTKIIKGFPGQWRQNGNTVTYIPEAGKNVSNRGQIISEPKDIIVDTEADVNVEDFDYQGVRAQLIKRIGSGERKFAVRQRDPKSDTRHDFKGTKYFKLSKDWILPARYVPLDHWENVTTKAVLSDLSHKETAIGNIYFTYESKEYNLTVFQGHNDDSGWTRKDPKTNKTVYLDNRQETEGTANVLFKDSTSAKETYGGGRLLVFDISHPEKVDYIDFNTASNLPCFFTAFCTCPVSPNGNRLPFAVNAGETSEH
ncbi:DUF1684 domain-containing protein [Secundilactobacillus silagei]|uniref:DUF1684 domain-containing protein n=1 Tax=Secundilactobacillus silagei JCM 19001 TaxID=1302250 RepID=A0A1Z5IG42_9LACO|nr:DUF1684 domain-containing protein [Secundilactobacillus silagei]TDG73366.1 hypothetical protein C5L25_000515 [Secundilactobacillus silagei JCM 19001]GAX00737.1 hypothetical protein IWT126_00752 [Secundilactobacillus silagei JCM 19001]